MKLFAKRKRTTTSGAATEKVAKQQQQQRSSYASDPIVEQLLQKDPSEWNAKERRMIKRYQQRKPLLSKEENEASTKDEPTSPSKEEGVSVKIEERDESNSSNNKNASGDLASGANEKVYTKEDSNENEDDNKIKQPNK